METERDNNWGHEEIDPSRVTPYIQGGNEYDRVLARAQLCVSDDPALDGLDDQCNARISGPSGCGKTTLGMSVALDVACIKELNDKYGLDIPSMNMDEIRMLHYIVVELDGDIDEFKSERESASSAESYLNNENSDEPHSRGEAIRAVYLAVEGEPLPSIPFFDVTLSHATNASDLLGHPDIQDDGSTQWIDGTITKAIRASQNGPVVLLLDEVNRAPTNGKDELYSALDGRVQVSLDGGRGGETIVGDPSNLIVISAMNEGPGHIVEPLDFAEKRRLGPKHNTGFLGEEYPEKEKELLMDVTPLSRKTVGSMVTTANSMRDNARSDETLLSYGVPTGSLIEWAFQAYANDKAGIENPLMNAGYSCIANAIYDHDDDEVEEAKTIIKSDFNGVGLEGSQNEAVGTMYICNDSMGTGCSWSASEDVLTETVKNYLSCPECGGQVNVQ